MPYLLGILKIIGMILLILLVVVLVLLAIVLFVPIRYKAEGILEDENKTAKATATWCCKIVRMKLDYNFPQKPLLSLKVFWIELLKEKKAKKKKEKTPKATKKKEESKKPKEKKKPKKEKYHPAINSALLEAAEAEEAAKTEKEKHSVVGVDKRENTNTEKNEADSESGQNNNLTNKFEKIVFKIQSIYDKINKIINQINYYWEIFQEKETQGLLKDAWTSIRKMLLSIKPREFLLNARIGFDSPDTTGKIYGYYCMMMPWITEDICLEPDFEEKAMDVKFFAKGKIRLITIVINGLRIVFDKRLKPLINKMKNGGKSNE